MNDPNIENFDVVIIGGGIIGSAMALALKDLPLSVALIEAKPAVVRLDDDYDVRTIGVSYTSRTIFQNLGIWPDIVTHATPILHLHISDKGHFGKTRIHAKKQGVDALGFVIEMPYLIQALQTALSKQVNLTQFCPWQLDDLDIDDVSATVRIQKDGHIKTLTTKCVLAADGQSSKSRDQEGISARLWDYEQTAIVTNLSFSLPHNGWAFERFTQQGPLAVLPLSKGRCGFIWSLQNKYLDHYTALSDVDFCQVIQEFFGYRLGKIKRMGKRQFFPIRLVKAADLVKPRFVLLGNAAQNIHPIAAQGMNLGLRDIANLHASFLSSLEQDIDIGSLAALSSYQQTRRRDRMSLIRSTDLAVRAFQNPLLPIISCRNSILLGLDLIPSAKQHLARRAMGIHFPAADLAIQAEP